MGGLHADRIASQIWMKSAVFERQQGHASMALETLKTALTKFPKFAKLYMIQGQIHQAQKNFAGARASYAAGLKACPKEVTLWVLASKLEELDGKSIRARALLEKGRQFNPGSDVLWAEAVGVEERSGGAAQAKAMLARGEIYFISTIHVASASPDVRTPRPSGVPFVRRALVNGNLGGAAACPQVALGRRTEEGGGQPARDLHRRASVLGGA